MITYRDYGYGYSSPKYYRGGNNNDQFHHQPYQGEFNPSFQNPFSPVTSTP